MLVTHVESCVSARERRTVLCKSDQQQSVLRWHAHHMLYFVSWEVNRKAACDLPWPLCVQDEEEEEDFDPEADDDDDELAEGEEEEEGEEGEEDNEDENGEKEASAC